MRRLASVLILLAAASAAPARAADCADAATQTDMNICAAKRFEAADTALNKTYQALLAKLDGSGKAALTQAEAAWLAYRDSQCGFETMGSRGGSVHSFVEALCRADLTSAQTHRLDGQLRCQEGDVSCGGQ